MIIAIVGIVHRYDLLPYYLDHYRQLGVEKFVIACSPRDLDPSGDLERFFAAQLDIEIVDLPRRFQRSELVGMIEEEVRQEVASIDDWVIPSDLDELNQYPATLQELVREMEADEITHVAGFLKDRLSPDGSLVSLLPFEQGVSIWEQFPLEADVTARITQGRTDKVLISRGDLAFCMGHHELRNSSELKPFSVSGTAHHFKWQKGLNNMLNWRVDNEQRARVPWSAESERLGKYLQEHGKVILKDVGATEGWCPMPSKS